MVTEQMANKDHSFLSRRAARSIIGIVTFLYFILLQLAIPLAIAAEGQKGEQQAIDFEAVDLEGRAVNGLDLKEKIVLMDFWAVWCVPCLDAIPELNQLMSEFDGEEFQIVGIASYSGTGDDVKQFLEDHPADYTMVVGDEDLVHRYGVIGYPTYFLIDPDGNIQEKYVGALPGLMERIRSDVEVVKDKFDIR